MWTFEVPNYWSIIAISYNIYIFSCVICLCEGLDPIILTWDETKTHTGLGNFIKLIQNL